MTAQPTRKLLFLAAVLLGADPCALPALLAELPSPTLSPEQAVRILTGVMQQHQLGFLFSYTVTLATCRFVQAKALESVAGIHA